MNFLALVQRLKIECGVSGSAPMTTTSQIAEIDRLVKWVNTAWMDIQSESSDWDWMRGSVSFPTVASKATYTPTEIGVTDFGYWLGNTFRNYDTAAGYASEITMDYIDYETWRNTYQLANLRTATSRPLQITITPSKALGLGMVPVAGYTVVGDYQKIPSEMVNDSDIPAIPAQFHMAIVYRAMMSYGSYEAASEVYQRGEIEFRKLMRRLRSDQLPEIMFCGSLA